MRAVRLDNDSVSLLVGRSENDRTYFKTKIIDADASPVAITSQDTLRLLLVADTDFGYDLKIIKAVLRAIESSFPVKLILKEADPSEIFSKPADWCIWLSNKSLKTVNSKRIIRIKQQESNDLITQTESNQWVISQRLNQEVALRNNLTMQLAILLLSENTLQDKITMNERRMIPDSLAWSRPEVGMEIQTSIREKPVDDYLIIFLVVLLLIERVIAYQKNQ